jgi:hypothetical protein
LINIRTATLSDRLESTFGREIGPHDYHKPPPKEGTKEMAHWKRETDLASLIQG